MTKTKLITGRYALDECIRELRKSNWIAVDTEFLREKTYYPLLCLIQIRSASAGFCIDVLAIDDLTPLQEIFADKNIVKILHACGQDLEALAQRIDQPICNLYDTQIAAAFCGYGRQVSYAALVESVCQVQLEKSYTRTDWSARPLSAAQLQYAIDDVNYINPLQQTLDSQLSKLGRQAWHRDECEKILATDCQIDPKDAWQHLKGGAKIPPHYQHSAKALSIWREHQSQKRNRPREWVLSTRALIEICLRHPANLTQLSALESVHHGLVKFSGTALLAILKSNSAISDVALEPIWGNGVSLNKEQRGQVKTLIQKLKRVAEEARISSSLLANRKDIETLIVGETNIPLLKGWRYEFFGKQILSEFDSE